MAGLLLIGVGALVFLLCWACTAAGGRADEKYEEALLNYINTRR
jgi:hypothetical protein